MVAEAVAAIKGTTIKEDLEEIIIDIRVPSYIPNSYIREESVKFDAYKSISQVRNKNEEKEIISEFEDRFGNIPKEVVNLIKVAQIRHLCRSLEIKKISENGNEILIRYSKKGIRPTARIRSVYLSRVRRRDPLQMLFFLRAFHFLHAPAQRISYKHKNQFFHK